MNNVGFDSSFSSDSLVKCGFIHPSSSSFDYMKLTHFPAIPCYTLNLDWNFLEKILGFFLETRLEN